MRILLILIAFYGHLVWADAKIVVRAKSASPSEFLSFLEARPGLVPFGDWIIRTRVSSQAESEVKRRLLIAQSEFLRGELVAAREKFAHLNELSTTQDWRSGERQTFAYAEMRLAQLAQDEDTRVRHRIEASRWGPVGLGADLFPKPLWMEYQKDLLSHVVVDLALDQKFPLARYILIDGKPIALTAGAKLETDQLEHRFTLVFDHRAPVTFTGTWETLTNWTFPDGALLDGSCEEPAWDPSVNQENAIGFFSLNCFVEGALPPKPLPAKVNLSPKLGQNLADLPMNPIPSRPVWKSGWFWGATGIVAILTYSLVRQSKKEQSPTPSTSVGF